MWMVSLKHDGSGSPPECTALGGAGQWAGCRSPEFESRAFLSLTQAQ